MTNEEHQKHHNRKARMFADMSTNDIAYSREERMLFAEEAMLHGELSDKIERAKRRKIIAGSVLYGMAIGAGLNLVTNAFQNLISK